MRCFDWQREQPIRSLDTADDALWCLSTYPQLRAVSNNSDEVVTPTCTNNDTRMLTFPYQDSVAKIWKTIPENQELKDMKR